MQDPLQENLYRRLLGRDPSVLDNLIAEYGGALHRLAVLILGQLGTAEDAEEATADAFAAAWERAAEYSPTRTSLKSWLLMLSKYAALNRRRQLQRWQYTPAGNSRVIPLTAAPEPVALQTPEDELLRADSQERLHLALASLPEAERDLLVRRYFFDEPIVEMARELGMNRAALDTRLWRARQMLRKLLGQEMEGIAHG